MKKCMKKVIMKSIKIFNLASLGTTTSLAFAILHKIHSTKKCNLAVKVSWRKTFIQIFQFINLVISLVYVKNNNCCKESNCKCWVHSPYGEVSLYEWPPLFYFSFVSNNILQKTLLASVGFQLTSSDLKVTTRPPTTWS